VVDDRLINETRFEVESDALTLIATQQPMARDLRTIAAVLASHPSWSASAIMPRGLLASI
jgi:phosphate uptake regulator